MAKVGRSGSVSRLVGPAALLLFVPLVSGCVGAPQDATVFVLEYELRHLGGDPAGMGASPGEHCGTAQVRDDHVRVATHAWDAIGRPQVFVIVDPTLNGSWSTTGDEPFPLALPAEVRPHVEGDDEVIATLEWRSDNAGNEGIWFNGRPVTTPFGFTHNARSGDWDAVAVLTEGPGAVRTYEAGMCA